MAPLEGELLPGDRGDHPEPRKYRSFGERARPGRGTVVAADEPGVTGRTRTRERPVQGFEETAPDVVRPRLDDRRVLIEVRQRRDLHPRPP